MDGGICTLLKQPMQLETWNVHEIQKSPSSALISVQTVSERLEFLETHCYSSFQCAFGLVKNRKHLKNPAQGIVTVDIFSKKFWVHIHFYFDVFNLSGFDWLILELHIFPNQLN